MAIDVELVPHIAKTIDEDAIGGGMAREKSLSAMVGEPPAKSCGCMVVQALKPQAARAGRTKFNQRILKVLIRYFQNERSTRSYWGKPTPF
ncbi:hypothetical protein [Acidocella sp.]|uniref:hypothetical protein n=1 Tax=Acidocella sp. TaxID=50710 RepID=UPI0017AEDA44|nr:hypothetical protein [Acidocella sp.]NNM57535.1 hypothetical protein [Acidocella sp.]